MVAQTTIPDLFRASTFSLGLDARLLVMIIPVISIWQPSLLYGGSSYIVLLAPDPHGLPLSREGKLQEHFFWFPVGHL